VRPLERLHNWWDRDKPGYRITPELKNTIEEYLVQQTDRLTIYSALTMLLFLFAALSIFIVGLLTLAGGIWQRLVAILIARYALWPLLIAQFAVLTYYLVRLGYRCYRILRGSSILLPTDTSEYSETITFERGEEERQINRANAVAFTLFFGAMLFTIVWALLIDGLQAIVVGRVDQIRAVLDAFPQSLLSALTAALVPDPIEGVGTTDPAELHFVVDGIPRFIATLIGIKYILLVLERWHIHDVSEGPIRETVAYFWLVRAVVHELCGELSQPAQQFLGWLLFSVIVTGAVIAFLWLFVSQLI